MFQKRASAVGSRDEAAVVLVEPVVGQRWRRRAAHRRRGEHPGRGGGRAGPRTRGIAAALPRPRLALAQSLSAVAVARGAKALAADASVYLRHHRLAGQFYATTPGIYRIIRLMIFRTVEFS